MKNNSFLKEWHLYNNLLESGLIKESNKAKFWIEIANNIGLRASRSSLELKAVASIKLDKLLEVNLKIKDLNVDDNIEYNLLRLGMDFLKSVRNGRVKRVSEIAKSGFNANFIHPKYGHAAIHDIAYGGSRRLLRAFLEADNIDFLLKDAEGRRASEIAKIHNRDRVIGRYLGIKEASQERKILENPHS